MKFILLCTILVIMLMSFVSSAYPLGGCMRLDTPAINANNLKNVVINVRILNLNGTLINTTHLRFVNGSYNQNIYSGSFCSYVNLNKGEYRTIVELPEGVTVVQGSLEHTFFRYPLDCEFEYEYAINDTNTESINTNIIFTNNLNSSISLSQFGLDSNKYNYFFTFIDGNNLNFTENTKMATDYSIQPHTVIKMTILSLTPTTLNKSYGDYYGIPLVTPSSDFVPLDELCGKINKITQKVIIPKDTSIFNKVDVWETSLHATQILDRPESMEYVWIKEGDVIEPNIVFYRYVPDIPSIVSNIFWIIVGAFFAILVERVFQSSKKKKKEKQEIELNEKYTVKAKRK